MTEADREGGIKGKDSVDKENKIRGQERKWVDGQLIYFSCNNVKEIQRQSVKEKQTEDMREEAAPYAAVSCHCRPWSRFNFFSLCLSSPKGRCSSESTRAESLSCVRTLTHTHACVQSHA